MGAVVVALLLASSTVARSEESPGAPPGVVSVTAVTLQTFGSIDAVQGVAVGERHVYALSGRRVSRHAKASGVPLARSAAVSVDATPIVHLDSGVVHAGRLYAAHSDWPRFPTRSSVEMWDPTTLEHVGSHAFGTRRGAFTWLDRYAGAWWGTFTDYGRIAHEGETEREPREIRGTRLVEMDDGFGIVRSWTFPDALTRRFAPMSNSGGSWGPDGRLYVTGHDRAEAYVIALPDAGGTLDWIATVALPDIAGQGIAWDRSDERATLYGLDRSRRAIVRMRLPWLQRRVRRALRPPARRRRLVATRCPGSGRRRSVAAQHLPGVVRGTRPVEHRRGAVDERVGDTARVAARVTDVAVTRDRRDGMVETQA